MRSVRPTLFRLPVAATLAAPCLLGGCIVQVDSEGYVATEQKRFDVAEAPEVTLATFDGQVEVRGWDRPEVVVDVEKRGSTAALLDQIRVESEQDGRWIRVRVRRPAEDSWGFMGAPQSAKIVARVPGVSDLLARSDDGSIRVEDLEGSVDLRTADGSVTAFRITGDVRAHTGDGRIRIEDVSGRCDLTTGDGSVSVRGQLTDVSVRTGDGSVTLRALPGSRIGAAWSVESGDGPVLVMLPAVFDADLDAFTGDGRIHLTGLAESWPGRQDFRDDDRPRRSLKLRLGNGGRPLKIRTADGSIALKAVE